MKIVIDIPKEMYIALKQGVFGVKYNMYDLAGCVMNGTLIPKGCGRLIDAEKLKKDYPHDTDWEYPVNTNRYVVESIDNAPTICI